MPAMSSAILALNRSLPWGKGGILGLFVAALAGWASAWAGDPPPVKPDELAGHTLSGVAYLRGSGTEPGGGLRRIMLQVYLDADGSALIRYWVPERNGYSAPNQTRWSLSQNRLCIDMPAMPAGGGNGVKTANPLCAVVHIWWPRIAGIGAQPYAMLDGDLQPGNIIAGRASRAGSAAR